MKKENAATFCFEFSGDSINLSNLISTKSEQTMNELHSTEIGINKMSSNIALSFISSSLSENTGGKSDDGKTIEKQITNFELNRTPKNRPTLDSKLSNGQNEAFDRLKLLLLMLLKKSLILLLLVLASQTYLSVCT